jgi:UDP-2-acetamido-2-deoxy-ribo-hexuluronate aminotransferase
MNTPSMPFIDLKTQYQKIKSKIQKRIDDVLEHGQYIMGPEHDEFEAALAKYVGCKHALAMSNGTDALMVPMMALGIGPGDEVITSAFSFFASAEVISLVGAKPVFVDIDPLTYTMDHKLLEAKITKKTKAIMPVSLYGQTADMDQINSIAKNHGIPVIEDAAQSFGATYKGKQSGNLSLVAGTSFFPAKPLGCYGDGGAIFTNDDALALAMREIRVHGSERRYYHTRLGINGRLDTLQCAILLEKLAIFPDEVKARHAIAKKYDELFLGKIKNISVMPERTCIYAQYTIEVENRDQFAKKLQAEGIPTSVHYPLSLNKQPYYEKLKISTENFTLSDKAASQVISLPMHPYMRDEEIQRVAKAVIKYA